jgi:site-specific DNA-methyltransferase (adenine-specific)/modification methylase
MRVETIGDATLYLGDSVELRAELPPVAALITDPPYGQSLKVNTGMRKGSRKTVVVQRGGGVSMCKPNMYEPIEGDDEPFEPAGWLTFAPIVLLWGAHKFADRLPEGQWLVWDKVPTGKIRDQGDGEAAWINRPGKPMRIFRLLWDGLCVGEGARHEVTAGQQRYHPAQKPEILMRWCIEQAGRPESICDPYMGSGSTGVAAAQMGIRFVGVEKSQVNFSNACRRIEAASRQVQMFAPSAPKAEQMGLIA